MDLSEFFFHNIIYIIVILYNMPIVTFICLLYKIFTSDTINKSIIFKVTSILFTILSIVLCFPYVCLFALMNANNMNLPSILIYIPIVCSIFNIITSYNLINKPK
jgi:hypothetical protein